MSAAVPKSILVRSPNWIGDQVLAYPFFHFLRREYPRARIVAACVPWVADIQFRNLIDDVYVLPNPAGTTFGARLEALNSAARDLASMGSWDLGFCLPNSLSSAWTVFRAGTKERRGYSAEARWLLLNRSVSWEKASSLHRADAYVRLLPESAIPSRTATEFWGVPPENDLDPGIPGVIAEFDATKAWPEAQPVEKPEGDYWILAPGSTAESRRWPEERFLSLAREIVAETGWPGLVVGGAAEAALASRLCEDRSVRLKDYTARGPVSGLWKLMRGARFVVANDSGLAHVASLCGAPVQIAWGGGNPNRTRPIGPGRVRTIFSPPACWPCERNICSNPPGRRLECLHGIEPEAVWKEIKNGLRP